MDLYVAALGGIVGDHGGLVCLTMVFHGRQGPRSMVTVVARILVGTGGWSQRLLQAGCVGPDVVASGHPVWALSHYTGRRVGRFPSVALPPTSGRVVAPCRLVCGACACVCVWDVWLFVCLWVSR